MVNQKAKYRGNPAYVKLRKSQSRERSPLRPRQLLFGRRNVGARSKLDSVFSALSDPTRRGILERLSQGEASVTELANPFDISLPAISKHLHVLESAGLLTRQREGRTHRLHLNPTPLISTAAWIDHYRPLWQTQLEAL